MNNAFELRSVRLALSVALLFIVPSLLNAATSVQDLRIGGYTLVSKTRIDRHHYELAYSANLTNRGTTDVSGATARLARLPSLLVVDGQLSFGRVPTSQTGTSTDTFTLRWPISKPIDPKRLKELLRWKIAFNAAPLANAGPDQSVALGATVLLDGSASSDTDGDPLTYRWVFTAIPVDSVAVLANENTTSPSFVTDRPGTYELQLIVHDGTVESTRDSVRISTANSAPVANAGPDPTAFVDSTVALDGTASTDVDGDSLGYQWGFTSTPAGSRSVLENATGAHPSFMVDKPGDYLIQLVVSDGQADSAPDSVQVNSQNSAPVATAGPDQTVLVNTSVKLDGNGSHDVDGDPLTYRWSLLNKPVGSTAALVNETAVNPSFAVDKPGSYTIQLIVNDGTVDSASDQVVVSTQNSRPVANAGPDRTATVGGTVAMDGNGSEDGDGDPLSFQWSLLSKPADGRAILSGANSASGSFIPDTTGEHVAQLIVSDGRLDSDPDTATVTVNVDVRHTNQAPQITSSSVTTATVGVAYSYDVEATDPDGDALSYSLGVAPAGMTINGRSGLITWTPARKGDFPVNVRVTDSRGASASQSFTVKVSEAPVLVPDVVGKTQMQAEAAITAANLSVGEVTGITLNCETDVTCPTTPLTVHSSGRYLKGANAVPFLLHGDSAWSAIVQLTPAQMDTYLIDRKNKKFNTVTVKVLEKYFADAPPKTKNEGYRPFLPVGTNSWANFFKCSSTACTNVITSTETNYWARVDTFVDKAAANGMMVLFVPAWYGDSPAKGFSTQLAAATATQCYNFGFWLGNRYKTKQNIIWAWGGDNAVPSGTARTNQIEMMQGAQAGLGTFTANHLHTIHFSRTRTTHDDYNNYLAKTSPKYFLSDHGSVQVDLDALYTTHTVVPNSARAYNRATIHPTFLLEALYEDSALSAYYKPRDMRRQAYSALLSGTTGHVYGQRPLWCFDATTAHLCPGDTWTTLLNDLGTQHMAHVRNAFNSRQWYNLKPDFATGVADFVVGGSPTTWSTMTSRSYIARARSADNKLAMAYLPYSCSSTSSSCTTQLIVKVDMAKLATPASDRMARWYNPTNGSYHNICGTRLGMAACGTGSVTFTTPGGHSNEAVGAKTNDWLLVIDVGTGPTT
ncbi:MAG: DUF4038 domain-containing protein [Gammaproteobacteria bacterium]